MNGLIAMKYKGSTVAGLIVTEKWVRVPPLQRESRIIYLYGIIAQMVEQTTHNR